MPTLIQSGHPKWCCRWTRSCTQAHGEVAAVLATSATHAATAPAAVTVEYDASAGVVEPKKALDPARGARTYRWTRRTTTSAWSGAIARNQPPRHCRGRRHGQAGHLYPAHPRGVEMRRSAYRELRQCRRASSLGVDDDAARTRSAPSIAAGWPATSDSKSPISASSRRHRRGFGGKDPRSIPGYVIAVRRHHPPPTPPHKPPPPPPPPPPTPPPRPSVLTGTG